MTATAVRHAGITVTEIERSAAFYRIFFGFVDARRMNERGSFLETICGIPGIEVTTLKMTAPGGGMIELLQYRHPRSATRSQALTIVGCSHLALTVPDIHGVYKRLREANVPLVSEPTLSEDGKAIVCFCRDPDGVALELVEMVR